MGRGFKAVAIENICGNSGACLQKKQTYGKEYAAAGQNGGNGDKKIQDAHEAIRPTDISRTPASLKDSLTRDQFRLYQLV